jgi:putative endonuclease
LCLHLNQQVEYSILHWCQQRSSGRIYDHKNKAFKGFTSKYEYNKLVYYEEFQWIHDAIDREKQLKAGSRQKKIDLIVANNPSWEDLSIGWYD